MSEMITLNNHHNNNNNNYHHTTSATTTTTTTTTTATPIPIPINHVLTSTNTFTTNTPSLTNTKLLSLASGFTVIDKGPLRLVITDAPTSFSLRAHTAQLRALNVKHVFRACEPTYKAELLEKSGIRVHELFFPDGEAPSDSIANLWLSYLYRLFLDKSAPPKGEEDLRLSKDKGERIAVHCITGLGRASVLAALALIELCNMTAVDAVNYIRAQRRGAINRTQLQWLMRYKRKGTNWKRLRSVSGSKSKSYGKLLKCCLM